MLLQDSNGFLVPLFLRGRKRRFSVRVPHVDISTVSEEEVKHICFFAFTELYLHKHLQDALLLCVLESCQSFIEGIAGANQRTDIYELLAQGT